MNVRILQILHNKKFLALSQVQIGQDINATLSSDFLRFIGLYRSEPAYADVGMLTSNKIIILAEY